MIKLFSNECGKDVFERQRKNKLKLILTFSFESSPRLGFLVTVFLGVFNFSLSSGTHRSCYSSKETKERKFIKNSMNKYNKKN
jgi:hypothetical protein